MLLSTVALAVGVHAQSAPEPPSSLGASISGTTVTLEWRLSAAGGAPQSYLVEVGSSPGASNLMRVNTGSSVADFVARDLIRP